MNDGEVLRAEVLEGPFEGEPERPSRRITAGPIIAIIVILVLIFAVGIYFLWGRDVSSVQFLNAPYAVENADGKYGIQVDILVMSKGAQTVNGKGTLDISLRSAKLFTQQVTVEDDRANVIVDYTSFVTENGTYDLTFSMEGEKASTSHEIVHVPERVNLSFSERLDNETGETSNYVLVTPDFGPLFGVDIMSYAKNYRIAVSIADPQGGQNDQSLTMYDMLSDPYLPYLKIEGEYMGYYSISAVMENLLVKTTSDHRTVSSVPEVLEVFLNKAPVIVDFSVPSRIKKGQETEFRINAEDRDTNGGIDYLLVDWDVKNAADYFQEFQDYTGGNLRVKHTFTESGKILVEFTVGDNGELEPGVGEPTQKRFVRRQVEVTVTL